MMDRPTSQSGDSVLQNKVIQNASTRGLVVATLGFLLSALLSRSYQDNGSMLLHAYLHAWMFFITIGLGLLFFVLVQHLTRAGWSVVPRRLAECLLWPMPLLLALFVPVLISMLMGNGALYPWADVHHIEHDPILQGKAAYLNVPFFIVRFFIYGLVWVGLSRMFRRKSIAQDQDGQMTWSLSMQRWSAPGMMAFGLTLTFASFDWLMSLDPHWYSTIFGVYTFAGSVMSALAVLILTAQFMGDRGLLGKAMTVEHYHDLGKLLFGFVFFWGYIAFSQYMLIWYADLPEETSWLLIRQTHGWQWIGLALLVIHLLVPYPGLLSRHVKRNPGLMRFWCIWLLVAHWLDLYWLIMPSAQPSAPPMGLLQVTCWFSVAGLMWAGVAQGFQGVSLVPPRDPRLAEALAFENI